MHGPSIGLRGVVVAGVGLLALGAGVSFAAEGSAWRLERGDVRVVVPLKPGGAFEAATSSLSGTLTPGASKPLALTGEILVELATIDTGIGLRNQHLREKYLQVSKGRGYDKAVLSEIVVEEAGDVDFRGRTGFTGMLLLHGVKRQVVGTAELRDVVEGARVQATFPLTLTDFAIVPPEYLGVGVANRVIVKVQFTATPARPAGSSR